MRLVDPYIPVNWNQECQALSEPSSYLSAGKCKLKIQSDGRTVQKEHGTKMQFISG